MEGWKHPQLRPRGSRKRVRRDSNSISQGNEKIETIKKFVKTYLPAGSVGDQNYRRKVHGKVLLLSNPTQRSPSFSQSNRRRQKRLATIEIMGSRALKEAKLHSLDAKHIRYELFLPLREQFQSYAARTLFNNKKINSTIKGFGECCSSQILAEMGGALDLTGCEIEVCESSAPSLVGISGIVIENSQNTFRIITKRNRIKVIPKWQCSVVYRLDFCKNRLFVVKKKSL
mmetsp:Transcript_24100/g.33417  ORF Transcript_24100/g.33417 Transcript_24100/m.33417 type:complete len:229 (-) Transcript_24100:94-780(-)|eukprot:jgi/Bigna1/89360/estExt_fgenesh1_pg.C_480011